MFKIAALSIIQLRVDTRHAQDLALAVLAVLDQMREKLHLLNPLRQIARASSPVINVPVVLVKERIVFIQGLQRHGVHVELKVCGEQEVCLENPAFARRPQ